MKSAALRSAFCRSACLPFRLSFLRQAQTTPVPNPQLASKELNARVEALLKKMTLEEKIGQTGAIFGRICDRAQRLESELRRAGCQGPGRLDAQRGGRRATNHYQHIADGEVAAAHPHSLRSGCDPRPSHHVSRAAGHRRQLGSSGRRDGGAHRRQRSARRRPRLGLLADGGHRPRPALGTHRRVQRRRPLSRARRWRAPG